MTTLATVNTDTIDELVMLHRHRQFTIRQVLRANNATAALVRSALGYRAVVPRDDYDSDKAHKAAVKSNEALKKLALGMIRDVEKGHTCIDDHAAIACIPYILHAQQSRKPFDDLRKNIEKRQCELVRTLAVWEWAEPISGLAEGSIASIIGECGNLSNYANPGKVWKRMGLAPYRGKSMATWKKCNKGPDKLSSAEWIEIGDRQSGRTVAFNIGESLIKKKSEYRAVYDERKQYEQEREANYAHGKAKRYMVKRLIRDLWRVWRDEYGVSTPCETHVKIDA